MFGKSEPGAVMHWLIVVREGRGPLGQPEPKTDVYAIAPVFDNASDSEKFIASTVYGAAHDPKAVGPVVLAVFTMELTHVTMDDGADEVSDNRARVLQASGHLEQHAKAVEVTRLYAAAADGRRWTGMHWLTGSRAGQIDGPTCHGPGSRADLDSWSFARMIRATVGLPW